MYSTPSSQQHSVKTPLAINRVSGNIYYQLFLSLFFFAELLKLCCFMALCTAQHIFKPCFKFLIGLRYNEPLQDINICFKPFLCGFGFLFGSFSCWRVNLLNHSSLKKTAADFPLGISFYCFHFHVSTFTCSIYTA